MRASGIGFRGAAVNAGCIIISGDWFPIYEHYHLSRIGRGAVYQRAAYICFRTSYSERFTDDLKLYHSILNISNQIIVFNEA